MSAELDPTLHCDSSPDPALNCVTETPQCYSGEIIIHDFKTDEVTISNLAGPSPTTGAGWHKEGRRR